VTKTETKFLRSRLRKQFWSWQWEQNFDLRTEQSPNFCLSVEATQNKTRGKYYDRVTNV